MTELMGKKIYRITKEKYTQRSIKYDKKKKNWSSKRKHTQKKNNNKMNTKIVSMRNALVVSMLDFVHPLNHSQPFSLSLSVSLPLAFLYLFFFRQSALEMLHCALRVCFSVVYIYRECCLLVGKSPCAIAFGLDAHLLHYRHRISI